MKRNALLLVFPLLLAGCFKKTAKEAETGSTVSATSATQTGDPNDPIIIKVGHRTAKASEILRIMLEISRADLKSMSNEEVEKRFAEARTLLLKTFILAEVASKKGYRSKKEFAEFFEKSDERVSSSIYTNEFLKSISDADLNKEYEEFVKTWPKNLKQFRISMIVVTSKDEAVKVRAMVGHKPFEKLAEERSKLPVDFPGKDAFVRENQLRAALGESAAKFALTANPGDISAPIALPDGSFAIIRLNVRSNAAVPSVQEAKNELSTRIFLKHLNELFKNAAKNVEVFDHNKPGQKLQLDDQLEPVATQLPNKEAAKTAPETAEPKSATAAPAA